MLFSREKKALILFAVLLTLPILLLPALAEDADDDRPTPAYWRDVTVRVGRLSKDVNINIRSGPGTNYDKIGKLSQGDEFIITDIYDQDWYAIDFDGLKGYAAAKYVLITEQADQVAALDVPDIEIISSDVTVPYNCQEGEPAGVTGSIRTTGPIVEATAQIYDLRTLKVIGEVALSFDYDAGVNALDLSTFGGKLDLGSVNGGEKRLDICVTGGNGNTVTVSRDYYVTGAYPDVAHMTEDCLITLTKGNAEDLFDNSFKTYWAPKADDIMTVTLPEGRTGALFTLEWIKDPESFDIKTFDSSGNELQSVHESNESNMYNFTYPLDERTRSITFQTDSGSKRLAEIRVIEKDRVSDCLMQWQPLPEKVDLLVVSTHQDDELLWFGGTIPYYVAQGKTVAVAYVATCSRARLDEAMEGLWTCGVRYHPIFLGYKDGYSKTLKDAEDVWGDGALEDLVAIMRRYRPEVVVCQDVSGEYGHIQHILCSMLVREAVNRCGDSGYYPDSLNAYGAWDVKKAYVHLYIENQIYMDRYDEPLENRDGLTALEIATLGFAKHVSQHKGWSMDRGTGKYDNRLFGLYQTLVGPDEAKNDLFEHIG